MPRNKDIEILYEMPEKELKKMKFPHHHSDIQALYVPYDPKGIDGYSEEQFKELLDYNDWEPIKVVIEGGKWLDARLIPPENFTRYITKIVKHGIHLIIGFHD